MNYCCKHGASMAVGLSAALFAAAPALAAAPTQDGRLTRPPLLDEDPYWQRASGAERAASGEVRVAQAGSTTTAPSIASPEAARGPRAEQDRAVAPIAAAGGVLTRAGTLVIEPSIEYQHSDINRFVVGGVVFVEAALIGQIEATQADRDAVTGTLAARYGITDRIEIEARLPYVYRNDSTVNTFVSSNQTAARTDISSNGMGDVEGAIHVQMNDGTGHWPFLVGNLRVKSTTGTSPFEVDRDATGIESELATGSGFWGIEPSLTVIVPSDPVVFYGNFGYLWNMSRDVDERVGSRLIQRVDPGDAIRLGLGMGIGLNERVSFSLGYQHDFISETRTKTDVGQFDSEFLSVGSLAFGVNYQVTDGFAVNVSLNAGVTEDAPDMRLMLRTPISLSLF